MYQFLILALLPAALAQNNSNCGCYSIQGSSSGFYVHHDFFDFRSITGGDYTQEPANVTNSQNNGTEAGQAGYLSSTAFTDHFAIQSWGKPSTADAPVRLQNSPQNIYIQSKDSNDPSLAKTHLTLRSYRNEDFASTAEVENIRKDLLYGSFRVRSRVRGDNGSCAGIFTYGSDTAELDIEVLTRDPTSLIRYTNQPNVDKSGNVVAQSEQDPALPSGDTWDQWHEHRIDWSPKLATYYIDGVEVVKNSYSVPKVPQYLDLNIWSDGGSWTGNLTIGGAAYLEVEYIEMVYNVTSKSSKRDLKKRKEKPCTVICAVDGVENVGTPEVLYLGSAPRFGLGVSVVYIWAAVLGIYLVVA